MWGLSVRPSHQMRRELKVGYVIHFVSHEIMFTYNVHVQCTCIHIYMYTCMCMYTHTCTWLCGPFTKHSGGYIINPRRACAARVTVVGLSVCPLVNISLLERLFVLKTLSHTQRATKVKKYVGFSLKPLRCRDTALAAVPLPMQSAIFTPRKTRMRIFDHATCARAFVVASNN